MKKIALSISVCVSIATLAVADSTLDTQSTRLKSMELSNYMTSDGFSIFANPAYMSKTKTGAFIELGLVDNGGANTNDENGENPDPKAFAGFFLQNAKKGNFGVILNRQNNNSEYFDNNDARQNNIDLLWGKSYSDFSLGARLTYGTLLKNEGTNGSSVRVLDTNETYNQFTNEAYSTSENEKAKDITVQFGGLYKNMEASLTYGMYSYTNSQTLNNVNGRHGKIITYAGLALDSNISNITSINNTENKTDNGASLFELSGSYNKTINDKSFVKFYGLISKIDYSTTNNKTLTAESSDYNSSTTNDLDGTNFDKRVLSEKINKTIDTFKIGSAYNLKSSDNVLLVLAGEYTRTTEKTKYSDNIVENKLISKIFVDDTTTNTAITNRITGSTTPNLRSIDITTDDVTVIIAGDIAVTEKLNMRFGLRESVYYNRKQNNDRKQYGTTYTNDDNTTKVDNGTTTSSDTSHTVADGTDNTSDEHNSQPPMSIAIGFGYKVTKDIDIDGLINANLFLEGPNFITGQTLKNISGRLAVNYRF